MVVTPQATSFSARSPVVVVDPPDVETHDCPAVIATNRDGALAAMDYLISLGHRRIGFISGRPDLQAPPAVFKATWTAWPVPASPWVAELIQAGDFARQAGFGCARRLLNLSDPPTAILASNDGAAIGAIKAIHEAGLCVPDDVSVVGFDGVPDARTLTLA